MPPSPPLSAPPAMPRWHWQPWEAGDRARPDGAWAAAHAWLALQPDLPAGALPLHRDAHGRPRFADGAGADAGWSHSGDGLLLAFARAAVLGVDMEYERTRPKALEIALRYFVPAEAAWLEAQSAEADAADGGIAPRDLAFVRLWCAKEAVLKAHGQGISFGLHRFHVRLDGDRAWLAACDPALGHADDWHLHEWAPHADYRAALAWHPRGAAWRPAIMP